MILELTNFKCFRSKKIKFNKLTILCGNNSSGKSSIIQSLLFLKYTTEQQNNTANLGIPLNGPYSISLGTTDSIINYHSHDGNIGITLEENGMSTEVLYEVDTYTSKLYVTLKSLSCPEKSIVNQNFYYLNSERIGPRVSNALETLNYNHVGWKGEYTAQILDLENGYYKVKEEKCFNKESPNYIKDQVNAWLSYITDGVEVKATTDPKTLSSQILLSNSISLDFRIATNLGFGISYILPIIVNGLIAEEGSIFIVENPEAHLHPSAQTKVGKFLAMLSSCNIRVIIETHSEHIINAVQVQAAKGRVDIKDININFFSQKDNNIQVTEIGLNKDGSLTDWPKEFFDESQKNHVELLKARRNV